MNQPIDIDWDVVQSEWDDREIDKIRKQLIAAKILADSPRTSTQSTANRCLLGRSKEAPPTPKEPSKSPQEKLNNYLHDELENCETWLRAFKTHGMARLLAFFVFAWGMNMWELTSERNKVRKHMAAACAGYLSAYHKAGNIVEGRDTAEAGQRERLREYLINEQELVLLILNSLTMPVDVTKHEFPSEVPLYGALLIDAMSVESAVYSGSAVATGHRAETILKLCNGLLETHLIEEDISTDKLRHILRELVIAHHTYYEGIAHAAKALQSAAENRDAIGRFHAISDLNGALDKLTKTQLCLDDEVYASELSAYRVAMAAWRDRLEAQAAPIVNLESAKVVYIYPFTISGVSGVRAQDIALQFGGDPKFNEISPERPIQQELTDMWTWGGRRESLNGTVKLPMPDLTVDLDHDAGATCTYKVELRFNHLGNHYLRLELSLTDPTINDINQALRRATIYSGEHNLMPRTELSRSEQTTVAQYAKSVIDDAGDWITEGLDSENPRRKRVVRHHAVRETTPETTPLKDKWGFKPDFDYHILVVVERASVDQSGVSSNLTTKAQFEEAYGSLLLQLLNREATTLDEWICWGRPPKMQNLLGDACFPSDFAIGTQSTTVLYMPSTPEWSRNGYEEVAEFAASFPPLIRDRKNTLDDQFDKADKFTQKDNDHRIPDQEASLDQLRSDLHKAVDEIRQARNYLVPSQLLSLSAEGKFLEQLYRRSRLPELRKDIDSYIERGRITIDRMNARETRLHDHRNRKSQDRIQFILLLVGFASLSGIFSLALTLWYGSQIPGWDSPYSEDDTKPHSYTDLALISAIYGSIFIVGLIFFFSSAWWMRTRRRRTRSA